MTKPKVGALETLGGYLKDIPPPFIRRYPSEIGERRRVTVHYSTWVGASIGATHYYGRVSVEKNSFWDSAKERWQRSWDDDEAEGQSFSSDGFDTPTEVIDYTKEIVAEHFSDDTLYEVDWNELDYFRENWIPKTVVHLYKREGD